MLYGIPLSYLTLCTAVLWRCKKLLYMPCLGLYHMRRAYPYASNNQTNQGNMKKLTMALFASLVIAATSFAGQEIAYTGKDNSKDKIIPATCFNDQELQFDVFGIYQDGNASHMAGPIRDHGWGGGIGINYFFNRYIGVGAEGYWSVAKPNVRSSNDDERTVFHNINGSLIFRLPIDEACLAPYAFVGGGAVLDGDQWAVAFAGLGVEYRIVPNKIGLFVDGRFNYYGHRFDYGEQNNYTARAGVRFVF